jgi:exopolysaccharide biosynthesis polyprenyl glycosylphosphotransferase
MTATFEKQGPAHEIDKSNGTVPRGTALTVPSAGPASRRVRRPWRSLLIAADAISVTASIVLGALARQPLGDREGPAFVLSLLHEIPFVPVYLLAIAGYGLYHHGTRRVRSTSFLDLGPQVHALIIGAMATLAASRIAYRWLGLWKIGWVEVTFMSVSAALLVPLGRGAMNAAVGHRPGLRSRVVIVGSGSVANSLARRLQHCSNMELVGFVDDDPHSTGRGLPCRYLGNITDLPSVCQEVGADRVIVAFSQSSPTWVVEMLRRLASDVRVSIVPRLFELVTWQSRLEELQGLTVMDVAPPRHGPVSRATKRALDIAVSAFMIFVQLPLIALVAGAIKATSPGPVFFRQDRVGYKGQVFRIFKFRTMVVGADQVKVDLRDRNEVDGPLFKLRSDPRVTPVGRFLRSTSLDELPQLFNVLLGQMSLVGPRPFVPDESAGIDGWAARRFEVRPGMTGLWQISGRNDLPFEELRQLDYAYVASWSLPWDLKILWHTPGSVLRRHGAY